MIQTDTKSKKSSREIAEIFIKIVVLLFLVIFIGTLGFLIYEGSSWIDSFQNSVFVLTTTGIITPVVTNEGKIFSSIYNIVTSIFVLAILTLLFISAVGEDITDERD